MVEIVAYNRHWPDEFERVAALLHGALGALVIRLDHIGSTSVPELCAKDVIDIQVTVGELSQALSHSLQAAGFVRCVGINGDHVPPGFTNSSDDWVKWLFVEPRGHRRANVHIRLAGKPNQRYALLFRDFLRANPAAATAYAQLKKRLAAALANSDDYPEVKDPAVDLIYYAAEAWAASTGWILR